MARPLRLEFAGAIYHITSRGNARDDIYLGDADRRAFLAILARTVDRYNWLCHAYCLMDNHYHLLIETLDPNLSLGMRQLNGIYTQTYNRNHKRVGHVFQGRFKSILVEKGEHLLELCRYIVLNPVKAGMVEKPEQYQWSSYKETVTNGNDSASFLTTEWVLGQFSSNRAEAQKRYTDFVHDGLTTPKSPWELLRGQVFLGSAQFIAKMQEKLGEKKEIGEIPREQRYPGRPSLKSLFAGTTNRQDRNEKIKTAHIEYGYTHKQIADELELHYTTISRVINMR
ncbi:MAG: transposase [Thermodesulfobacteriota bacterium]